jgi:hypothetical protein
MSDQQNRPPTKPQKAAHERLDKELTEITRSIERSKGNGPLVTENQEVRQGVAEELAAFIEKHADEMIKEAEQHRQEAYIYAKEIREQTADQLARLHAFTDSIKASQAEMAEVRMRFLSSSTIKPHGGGVAKTPTQDHEEQGR